MGAADPPLLGPGGLARSIQRVNARFARTLWLYRTKPGGPEGRVGVLKVVILPLVLANKALEWLTGRIPTDVDLLERLLVAEAELELVKAENKILRTEITQKVNAIMKRVEE